MAFIVQYWGFAYALLAPLLVFSIRKKTSDLVHTLLLSAAILIVPIMFIVFDVYHGDGRHFSCWSYTITVFLQGCFFATLYVGFFETIRRFFAKKIMISMRETLTYNFISNCVVFISNFEILILLLIFLGLTDIGIIFMGLIFTVKGFFYDISSCF